jgi:hypothetical protein
MKTIIFLLLCFFILACNKSNPVTPPNPIPIRKVHYAVWGTTGTADIFYDKYGPDSIMIGVKLPWSIDVNGHSGDLFFLQAHTKTNGFLAGSISIDGKEYQYAQSNTNSDINPWIELNVTIP